jgi:hypothetical protein
MEITNEEYQHLKDCHQMLGMISCYVEDFCREEDTTLIGVVRLLAEYHQLKSDSLYERLEELKKQSEEY